MKGSLEERNAEALALARQHEHVGEGIEVRDQAVWRADAERMEQMHARCAPGQRGELGEVAVVGGVVRAGRAGDDEGRRAAAPPKGDRCGDRHLDPLATCEPRRQHEERVRAVEIEPRREARARGREAERRCDIHAVRHDVDLAAREARD